MAKRGRKTEVERLLTLWRKTPEQPLPFSQIAAEAAKMGYTKRTVVNYLNKLTENGILEKIVDKNRNTFYKLVKWKEFHRALIKEVLEDLDDEFLIKIKEFALLEPYLKILKQLALGNFSTHQLNVPEAKEYLTQLKQLGLVIEKDEFCRLTFEGVLSAIAIFNPSPAELDKIAAAYKDEWLIFQEWPFLAKEPEIAKLVAEGIYKAAFFLGSGLEQLAAGIQHGVLENFSKYEDFNIVLKNEAALYALHLKTFFDHGFSPWVLKGETFHTKLWHVCAKNPQLRTFILEQLKIQKAKAESVEKFEELFKQFQ